MGCLLLQIVKVIYMQTHIKLRLSIAEPLYQPREIANSGFYQNHQPITIILLEISTQKTWQKK